MEKIYQLKEVLQTRPKLSQPSKKFNNKHLVEYDTLLSSIYEKYKIYFKTPSYSSVIYWYFGIPIDTYYSRRIDSNNITDLLGLCKLSHNQLGVNYILNKTKLNVSGLDAHIIFHSKPSDLNEYLFNKSISYTQCINCKHKYSIYITQHKSCGCSLRQKWSIANLESFRKARNLTNNENYRIGARKREDKFNKLSEEVGRNIRLDWVTQEMRENQSERMRKKIAEGYIPPKNNWSKTRIIVNNIKFRSTWEAYFYLFKIDNGIELAFEKITLKYFNSLKNKNSNYITDFVNYDSKEIFEIKPNCKRDNITVLEKEASARLWCGQNYYSYIFISDNWFKENYNEVIIVKYKHLMNENIFNLLIKNLKQFKKEKNENY